MNLRRSMKFWWQRRTRGWDDRECWNLDHTIALFALPRLKRLREIQHGHPTETGDEWEKILDEIEWWLALHCEEPGGIAGNVDVDRYRKAGALFGEYFGELWD